MFVERFQREARVAACLHHTNIVPVFDVGQHDGGALQNAVATRDLPVVQGVVLFVASMIVLINVAVDVLYGFLDPRIRYE